MLVKNLVFSPKVSCNLIGKSRTLMAQEGNKWMLAFPLLSDILDSFDKKIKLFVVAEMMLTSFQ